MPKATVTKKAPAAAAAPYQKTSKLAITEAHKRHFGIGQDIQPKRDLTRYVKWPKYVRLQRQKRVLYQRLKVPPAISQFAHTAEKNLATNLFKFLVKYKPEDKAAKKQRLLKLAESKDKGKEDKTKKPYAIKYGMNHITALVEQKKAQLVVIAHDVDPIEIVVWLPALCRKMDVPYIIVKGKARLGQLVHKKTAAAVAVVDVRAEDKHEFSQVVSAARESFLDKYEDSKRHWGGGVMGYKSQAATLKHQRAIAKEEAQRNK